MNFDTAQKMIDELWMDSIIPKLVEYIKIPNKSPHFDDAWAEHGYMEDAVQLISGWCREHAVAGMELQIVRIEGRTPLIFMDIPAQGDARVDDTILLYGHLDKQPEMTGWADGLGPWVPVIRDGLLYGRGGADDGYAAFASLAAIMALRDQGIAHARCIVLIEACEESGSYDLPHYIEMLKDRIGTPSLVVCLDSGAGNYDQMWLTTSLRGMAAGTLRADVLTEGVHSGYASGVVPSSFRVLRQILSRLEDENTGRILPQELYDDIPAQRVEQVQLMADLLGDQVHSEYPFIDGMEPMAENSVERLLNRTWRPALSVTGVDGIPSLDSAGNVLRPHTSLKLSLRLPPTVDGDEATEFLTRLLESDPPSKAKVAFTSEKSATGWNAPDIAPWLHSSLDTASMQAYGRNVMYMGEGGSIPFMAMLGDAYPEAQFVITGVLGPKSNAHGPNEFLHIQFAQKLTACVAQVLADHCHRPG